MWQSILAFINNPTNVGFLAVAISLIATVVMSTVKKGAILAPVIAAAMIFVIAVLTIFFPPLGAPPSTVPPSDAGMNWVYTGQNTDWAGRDHASTTGAVPKYSVGQAPLCDPDHAGSVAVCWENRPSGFPAVEATDIVGSPAAWCTYKDQNVGLSVAADGTAPPGKVFLCARAIPRS